MRGKRIVFVSFLLLFLLGLSACKNRNDNITKRTYKQYREYHNQFMNIEKKYLDKDGYVNPEDFSDMFDKVEKVVKEGIEEGIIKAYHREDDNIYMKFTSGIGYVFVPEQEEVLSNNDTKGKIVTIEPTSDNWATKFQNKQVLKKIKKHVNTMDSAWPHDNAEMIVRGFPKKYQYDQKKDSWENDTVTVEKLKELGKYKTIIFEGHGGYNSEIHSYLVTDEADESFQKFEKYEKQMERDELVVTSFFNVNGGGQYAVTNKFFDRYLDKMDHAMVFLGACSSGADDTLAQSFLKKGADVVLAYSDTTNMAYEMLTRSFFFFHMTNGGSSDVEEDTCWTVKEAFDYTKKQVGENDKDYRVSLFEPISEFCYFDKESMVSKYAFDKIHTEKDMEEKIRAMLTTGYWAPWGHDWRWAFQFHEDGTYDTYSRIYKTKETEEVQTYEIKGNELIMDGEYRLVFTNIIDDKSDLKDWNRFSESLQKIGYKGNVFYQTNHDEEEMPYLLDPWCLVPCSLEMTKYPLSVEEKEELESVTESTSEVIEVSLESGQNFDEDISFGIVYGKNQNGNVIWKYETEKYPDAELEEVQEIGLEGNTYYFNDNGTVTALNKKDGSVVWKNKDFKGSGIVSTSDEAGNLYLCGYYNPVFFAVSKDGKTIKKIDHFDEGYGWPSAIRYDYGNVYVTMHLTPQGNYYDDEKYQATYCVDLSDYSYRMVK